MKTALMSCISYAKFVWRTFGQIIPRFNPGEFAERLTHLDGQYSGKLEALLVENTNKWPVFFRSTTRYYIAATPVLPPAFDKLGKAIEQPEFIRLLARDVESQATLSLLLSGLIGTAYWGMLGDDFHVTKGLIKRFPLPSEGFEQFQERIAHIFERYTHALPEVIEYQVNAGKRLGRFDIPRLRDITDDSDVIFKDWLSFTDQMWEEMRLHNVQMVGADGYEAG